MSNNKSKKDMTRLSCANAYGSFVHADRIEDALKLFVGIAHV